MVDFVALVTPPILAGPDMKPANGDIYIRSTNTVAKSGLVVVPFQAHGKVVDGTFKSLDGGPLLLVVTPEGVALEIHAELVQDGPNGRRDKYRISRTVSTPNATTVTWDALIDVIPVDAGPDVVVPSWVAETKLARDEAVTSATTATNAKNAAAASAASISPGVANGVATLDAGAKLPEAQLPARLSDASLAAATDAKISTAVAAIPDPTFANTMVLFGDSWEYYNFGNATRPSFGSRGYAANGNVFLGHRLKLINKGVGGEDTLALLARADADLVAVQAGWALIGSGTNDISNGRTFNQITQNLATLYGKAEASGKRVVGRTVPPRTGATTAAQALRSQVNQWIRGQALTRPGFVLLDIEQAVMDTATNDFVATFSYDGVHLANPGAIAAGLEFARVLAPLIPAAPVLIPSSDPRNLLASNGGAFPGAATVVPTGWTANGWSQGAPVYSKVARTDGIPGQWQQIVVPTDSRGFLRSTNLVMSGGAFVGGDVVRAAVEFQAENLETAPTANTQALYITVEFYDGTTTTSRFDLEWSALANENGVAGTQNENEGKQSRSGIMLTEPLTIPAVTPGTQTLSMTIQARCGGTYRFARASMFKV